MRGKDSFIKFYRIRIRITPAYAGKRLKTQSQAACMRDHPRLCGEKAFCLFAFCLFAGSPPPMRGKA